MNTIKTSSPRQRYIDAEFDSLHCKDSLRLKVSSDSGATKWLSIGPHQAQRIREILKEPQQ